MREEAHVLVQDGVGATGGGECKDTRVGVLVMVNVVPADSGNVLRGFVSVPGQAASGKVRTIIRCTGEKGGTCVSLSF